MKPLNGSLVLVFDQAPARQIGSGKFIRRCTCHEVLAVIGHCRVGLTAADAVVHGTWCVVVDQRGTVCAVHKNHMHVEVSA